MDLSGKQIIFRNPRQVSECIGQGMRALAENYSGRMQSAKEHCLQRVETLTEARLTESYAKNPPAYTRDGQSFMTLIWVLLVDGMLPHRPPAAVREWLVTVVEATDLFDGRLNDEELDSLTHVFVNALAFSAAFGDLTAADVSATLRRVWSAKSTAEDANPRLLPSFDRLFIGREKDIDAMFRRIGLGDHQSERRPLTIIRGWPGVGKSALINAIVHDDRPRRAFSDGVLWMSLGPNGDLFAELQSWARQLGALNLLAFNTMSDLVKGLRSVLLGRDIFILVDDVWTVEQGLYIKSIVDLKTNTVLMSTRFKDVAERLGDVRHEIYPLEGLSEAHGVELLELIAPEVVSRYRERVTQLVRFLEGLPLALRVAGPTLRFYHEMHFDVNELIDEFEQDYNRLLRLHAPGSHFDEVTGQTTTIELLFKRSVDTLSEEAHFAFAALGTFKEKPALIELGALEYVWNVSDPKPLIANLVGRGLMEATPDGYYRVHQTLHLYANKLLDSM